MASSRSIFTAMMDGMKFRAGRLYETFWNSQSNLKYGMVLIYPAYLYSTRWRAETKFKYNVFVQDEQNYPTFVNRSGLLHVLNTFAFGDVMKGGGYWSNGSVYWGSDNTTVEDLKNDIYSSDPAVPKGIKMGCKGRMFEDTDNLSLAVRTFCKRDPRVLIWQEEDA